MDTDKLKRILLVIGVREPSLKSALRHVLDWVTQTEPEFEEIEASSEKKKKVLLKKARKSNTTEEKSKYLVYLYLID